MSASLANSAKYAITGPALGITDINQFPAMQNVNSNALSAASPLGLLNVTRVDTSGRDAAIAACSNLTFSQVKEKNIKKGVTSTDTSCGWIQYSQSGNSGASVLGTNFSVISPMPTGMTVGAKYYPPILTTSSNSISHNWANGIPCTASADSFKCSSEAFTNPRASSKFASVDDEFVTPFVHKYPMPLTTPMSRDQYIQADANTGTMVATLYQESERGLSDPAMQTRSSYSMFTKSMTHAGSNDKDSWQNAFQTFQPVRNDMPRPSRDISVVYANLESHDFCAEMNEQTIINENNLACLQREWLRKGGKPTDYNYPDARLYGSCYGRVLRK